MGEDDIEIPSGSGTTMLLTVPLLSGGIYSLFNHSAVHGAIHGNITPEAFAGLVAWMLWGLEIVTLIGLVLLVAALIIAIVAAIITLT